MSMRVSGSAAATAAAIRGSPLGETEHLLLEQSLPGAADDSDDVQCSEDSERGKTSVVQTVMNLMKTCMGTGVLALSFACKQGGSLLFCVGLPAVALWNVYAVHRLVLCLKLISDKKTNLPTNENFVSSLHELPQQLKHQRQRQRGRNTHLNLPLDTSPSGTPVEEPPSGVSTLGMVAWYAFGNVGLQLLDCAMLFLLVGIIVAYVSGSITFLGDTPLTMGPVIDGLLCAFFMALISLVPHMGHLSWVSAVGLVVLLVTFVVISGYGVMKQERVHVEQIKFHLTSAVAIPLMPMSMTGISHLFGIAVFSFGIAPLTYNFRSAMQQPQLMVPATCLALSLTSIIYIVLGVGMLLLYPDLSGDLLHELPSKGWLPIVTRLAMVWVCIMTAPLLIIPCSELVEGKWQIRKRAALRFGICFCCVLIAVAMPSFVQVLALVGCACVGLVGFCLPPLFHLKLSAPSREYVSHQTTTWVVDTVMLTWGVAATILSTIYTFERVRHE